MVEHQHSIFFISRKVREPGNYIFPKKTLIATRRNWWRGIVAATWISRAEKYTTKEEWKMLKKKKKDGKTNSASSGSQWCKCLQQVKRKWVEREPTCAFNGTGFWPKTQLEIIQMPFLHRCNTFMCDSQKLWWKIIVMCLLCLS